MPVSLGELAPLDGVKRWVGLGVIADNVIHIGSHLANQQKA